MADLPVLTAREVETLLTSHGFTFCRQKGSHKHFKKPGHPSLVTVACHNGTLPTGTLRSIIRQTGLTVEIFLNPPK